MASAHCERCRKRLSVGSNIKTGPLVAYSEALVHDQRVKIGLRRVYWCRPCTIEFYDKTEFPADLAYL